MIILNETNEVYHASGAWGSTLVSTFLSSPRLAHAMRTGTYKRPETPAMRLGSRFHALMDPKSNFAQTHRCGPDADRRTKEWKAAEAEAVAQGITLVAPDDWNDLHRMRDSVFANPIAASLLGGAEQEIGFRRKHGPIQVQCRADILHRWDHMADLKTTTDLDEFASSVVNYGYHRQAAWYRWGVAEECGKTLPFSFIVVEKKEPLYRCRVIDLTPEFVAIGQREIETALADIVRRTKTNDWNDHFDAESLAPPGWLAAKMAA